MNSNWLYTRDICRTLDTGSVGTKNAEESYTIRCMVWKRFYVQTVSPKICIVLVFPCTLQVQHCDLFFFFFFLFFFFCFVLFLQFSASVTLHSVTLHCVGHVLGDQKNFKSSRPKFCCASIDEIMIIVHKEIIFMYRKFCVFNPQKWHTPASYVFCKIWMCFKIFVFAMLRLRETAILQNCLPVETWTQKSGKENVKQFLSRARRLKGS